jgi:hypothetical protein
MNFFSETCWHSLMSVCWKSFLFLTNPFYLGLIKFYRTRFSPLNFLSPLSVFLSSIYLPICLDVKSWRKNIFLWFIFPPIYYANFILNFLAKSYSANSPTHAKLFLKKFPGIFFMLFCFVWLSFAIISLLIFFRIFLNWIFSDKTRKLFDFRQTT